MGQKKFETQEETNFQHTLNSIKQMFPNKLALNAEDAASILGIEKHTIYNLLRKASKKDFPIKHRRVGGKLRFNIVDIARFLTQ